MRLFILDLAVILVAGCALESSTMNRHSVAEVVEWVHDNVRYVPDTDGDNWSPPEVTLERGYGDCEDMAILVLWMVYQETGMKGDFAIGWVKYGWHGWVVVDGVGWDPQVGGPVPDWYRADWYWSYDMAMLIAGED